MKGQDVAIQGDDGEFGGYLATPAGGTGRGLVVIQEIFGVNRVMRDICDQYAAMGFVAFAPDLFWRIEPGVQLTDKTKADWDRAFELFNLFDKDKGVRDIQTSLAFLRRHSACTGGKVGAVGYCLGGLMAYLTAARTDADAAVGYYAVGVADLTDEAARIRRPLMLHIAGKDSFVPAEAQAAMHKALDDHPQVTLHDYPACDHAFARLGGEHFDAAAAAQANARSLDFLREHLR